MTEWHELWGKACSRYAAVVVTRPAKVIACGWLFPVCFFALVWITFGPPYIGTDVSAYLRTEGVVADKNDAFEAAVVLRRKNNQEGRRLEDSADYLQGGYRSITRQGPSVTV